MLVENICSVIYFDGFIVAAQEQKMGKIGDFWESCSLWDGYSGTVPWLIVSNPANKRKPTHNIQVNSFSKTPRLNLLTRDGSGVTVPGKLLNQIRPKSVEFRLNLVIYTHFSDYSLLSSTGGRCFWIISANLASYSQNSGSASSNCISSIVISTFPSFVPPDRQAA